MGIRIQFHLKKCNQERKVVSNAFILCIPQMAKFLICQGFSLGYDFFHLFNFYYCTKSYYVSSRGLRRYGQLECIRTLKGSPSIHVNKTKNVELKPSCPHRDFLSPHGIPVLCQNIFSSRRFIFT